MRATRLACCLGMVIAAAACEGNAPDPTDLPTDLIRAARIPSAAPPGPIAFTLGLYGYDSDIALIEPDGTGFVRVTDTPEPEMMGGWAFDGSSFLFERGVSETEFQIWRANADGSGQQQITTGPGVRVAPNYSPDGTKIVYDLQSDLTGFDSDVVMANADGSNEVRLTSYPGADVCPKFSPDGTRVLFASNRASKPNGMDAWVMNVDGSDPVQLTSGGSVLCPTWSPDGTRIAFGRLSPTKPGIWVMNADGSDAVRVYANGFAAQPTWSSDGEWLVFHRWQGGGPDLYRVRVDGSELFQITKLKQMALNPAWRPRS